MTKSATTTAAVVPVIAGQVRVGPDWSLLAGTASQPMRLTSAVLTVSGDVVPTRKGSILPALRLSPVQQAEVREYLRSGALVSGSAAAFILTPSVGRGRPRITGMDADALAAFIAGDAVAADDDDTADDDDAADDDAAE